MGSSGHYIAVSFVLLDHVFVLGTPNIASVHRGTTKSSAHKNSCDGPEDIKPWIQSCAGGPTGVQGWHCLKAQ